MRKGFLIAGLLALAGCATLWFGLQRPIRVITPGGTLLVNTRAWNVSRVLAQAGFSLGAGDAVSPSLDELTGWQEPVFINRAASIRIVDALHGLDMQLTSRERIPANLLLQAGMRLYPGDRILLNGQPVAADQPLPYRPAYALQVIPAQKVIAGVNGQTVQAWSSASSLGQALWAAGITLHVADQLSATLDTRPANIKEAVSIQTARPVRIVTAGARLDTLAAGQTAAQVLAESGAAPQGMDYAIPAENEPVPENGRIKVVRVQEAIALNQTVIPYESDSIQDSNTEVGQVSILEPGRYGLKVSRERIRYEDGLEVSRVTDAEWVAAEPETELLGIGTKIVLKTLNTPSGSIEYWREITAVVTSYSPCRLGNDTCNSATASGMTLQKGIIAVDCDFYSQLAGMQVYIPGYGKAVVADCGGGIASGFWVDLGFSDSDYETWSGAVTVYFLPPVPPFIPYPLQ